MAGGALGALVVGVLAGAVERLEVEPAEQPGRQDEQQD
jgi:hypothetical protein